MIVYPSIDKFPQEFKAYCFDKIDGSNLRFQFSKKSGWYKYGTRNRLFDGSDPVFGEAIDLFQNTLEDKINNVIYKNKWSDVVIFAEFVGERSIAGWHHPDDKKQLIIIDAFIDNREFISPKSFVKTFQDLPSAKFLGIYNWNKNFIQRVRDNEIEGITFEGIVGKATHKNNMIRAKAKTNQWLDKIKLLYDEKIADTIINS